jgi:hypothetical protein
LDKAKSSRNNLFPYKKFASRAIRRAASRSNGSGTNAVNSVMHSAGYEGPVTSTGTAFCARLECGNEALPLLPTNGGRMMKVTKIAFAAALGTAALCGPAFAQDQGGYAGAPQAAAPNANADAQTRAQSMAQNSASKHTRKHQMSGNAQGSATAPADQAGSAASDNSQSSQGASSTQAPPPAQ